MLHHHCLFLHHLLLRDPPPSPPSKHPTNPPRLPLRHYLRPTKSTTIFLLFSIVYLTLILHPHPFPSLPPPSPPLPLCSSLPTNSLCCDTSSLRSDICFMRGSVLTNSSAFSLLLLNSSSTTPQTIRPYTRKWEPNTMSTIDELHLRGTTTAACEVHHPVPAIVFSTGGYTGNVYHEFNDGILPLYITAQHFEKRVVFLIVEYHDWWVTKYGEVLSRLSDFAPVDFSGDTRVHCFQDAIVGLRIHDELSIDRSQMVGNKSIFDFRRMLDEAYRPRVRAIEEGKMVSGEEKGPAVPIQPRLVIISRNGSRSMENEGEVAELAIKVGFNVEILHPTPETELMKMYRALNSCDVMVGVHGAAMTHFLFMRPGTVFIQVVPLGTDWAAETYYGAPAARMGLKYMRYQVKAQESSLYREYPKSDKVLRDPESVNAEGWEVTKRVYLDGQKVKLDLQRFRKRLVKAQQYLVGERLKKK